MAGRCSPITTGLTIGCRGCGAGHPFGRTKNLRGGPAPLTLEASGRLEISRQPQVTPPAPKPFLWTATVQHILDKTGKANLPGAHDTSQKE